VSSWLACFGWGCAATLFDREGVFLVGVIIFILAARFLGQREKMALQLMGAFAAVLALSFAYNHIIAPLLTWLLNGYWPDFKYQQLPWPILAEKPAFFARSGFLVYWHLVGFFLGDIPPWAAAVVVFGMLGLAVATARGEREGKSFYKSAAGFFLSQTILVWVMIVSMAVRNDKVFLPAVQSTYYFLPVIAMFGMTTLLLLSWFQTRSMLPKWCVALCLGGALAGNIAALPRCNDLVQDGKRRGYYESTTALLDALRNLRNPRHQISPEIADDRIFRYFHEGYVSRTFPVFTPDQPKRPREKLR
jgi:hypothetical protein